MILNVVRRWSLLITIGCAGIVDAKDWPRWRGPQGNGVSLEKGWLTHWPDQGVATVWKASVGVGFSAVTVSDGRVYTLGNEENVETVYCLDEKEGKMVWEHSYECPLDPNLFEGGPTTTPTVDGDRVYTFSRPGQLFCFEKASGKVLWEKQVAEVTGARVPTWGFGGSPVIHEDLLLLNVGGNGAALSKRTGDVMWTSDPGAAGYSTPVLFERNGETVMCLASSTGYSAVRAKTGEEIWEHRWLTRFGINASDPIVEGDQVFVSTGYRKGAVLLDVSGVDPLEVWRSKVLATQLNPAVLVDRHLYGTDGDTVGSASLRCVELATGELKWEETEVGFGSVMAADGNLIVLSESGLLMVASASSAGFQPTGRFQLPSGKYWTVPVLANGRIYCRNAVGDVFCLNVQPRNSAE